MRNKLKSVYIKTDTTCKELAKTALIQLILKVIYFYDAPINNEQIRNEINGILNYKLRIDRIDDALSLLLTEGKIIPAKDGFELTKTRREKFDVAILEHQERHNRIIEKYFSPSKSSLSVIQNWFENVTVEFFMEYRSEWIVQKAYKAKSEDAYNGLRSLVKRETYKDQLINVEDRDWLIEKYIKFFKSSDEDLNSIYWEYGTCAFTSSLITSSNSANQITVDTIANSKFILDTNILMYLSLEAGKYYDSYTALGKIFSQLNIQPGYFYISRDEYISSTSNKKDLILNIHDKYEESVIDQLDEDFIKTARARQCKTAEDYIRFFDTLLNPPNEFPEGIRLVLFDYDELNNAINRGLEDEELIELLNNYFKARHQNNNDDIQNTALIEDQKGKGRKPLMHDSGLIRGAEFLRNNEKCFILTRETSVKQYGILNIIRDEPSLSIGLDNLISLLAIDSGGIDIDPLNFKPLFAKIVKLALLPERGIFHLEDLAGMYDIEQNIGNLPDDEVISIAKEMHKFQIAGISDAKVSVEIHRRFQHAKMNLKNDLNEANEEIASEKRQKESYKKTGEKATEALRHNITQQLIEKNIKWYRNIRIVFFVIFPLATILATLTVIYQAKNNLVENWVSHVIGFFINIIAWFSIDLFVILPRLMKSYKSRMQDITKEVENRLNEIL